MRTTYIDSLIALRSAFERDEDWVAVGHVAYLIDRLTPSCEKGEPHVGTGSLSVTLH